MTETLHEVTLLVNGVPLKASVPARRLLSDCLRHDLNLTGTHVGCEHGVCGACTVLVDGRAIKSCNTLALQHPGAEITTIEGLAKADGTLHPMQAAFKECHGLQCGFCTPGMVMATVSLLAENPRPTEEQVRTGLEGNLCRCTGYHNIVRAALAAAEAPAEVSA